MSLSVQKEILELLKEIKEKTAAAPSYYTQKTVPFNEAWQQVVLTLDLLSLIDSEYEFTIDLSIPRVDKPIGIQQALGGKTPFVTEFTVTALSGNPLKIKLNDTGSPQVEYSVGEGRDAIIRELLLTNEAQANCTAKITVGWNSIITNLYRRMGWA